MEALDLAGRGRRARRREPVRDPVAPADLVEQHLAAATEAPVNCLPLSLSTSSGAPYRSSASRRPGRPRGRSRARPPRDHAIARMVIDAGHDPRLPQLPGDRVDQPRPIDDVELPQLHRRRPLPAHIVRRLARRARVITSPWRTRIRCTVARDGNGSGGAGPRMSSCTIRSAPHRGCARRSSHTRASTYRRRLIRARPRPARPVRQPRQPAGAIARQPRMHRLARHPDLGRHLRRARTVQHRHHRSIPLLDDRQRHQRQSRPPVADPRTTRADHGQRRQACPELQRKQNPMTNASASTWAT